MMFRDIPAPSLTPEKKALLHDLERSARAELKLRHKAIESSGGFPLFKPARIHRRYDGGRLLAIQLAKSVQTIFDLSRKPRMIHGQNVAKALPDFRVDGPAIYCAQRD
jgi:hypothetical protein